MKKLNLCFFLLLSGINMMYAQDSRKGTITTLENKVENVELKTIPNTTPVHISIRNNQKWVQKDAFGINGFEITDKDGSKQIFVAKTVMVNRSPNNLDELEYFPAPVMKEERHFLKELIKGDISLYVCTEDFTESFFVAKDGKFTQLVYKKYKRVKDDNVQDARLYRQTLMEVTKSKPEMYEKIADLPYNEVAFAKIINLFNGGKISKNNPAKMQLGKIHFDLGAGYQKQIRGGSQDNGVTYQGNLYYTSKKKPLSLVLGAGFSTFDYDDFKGVLSIVDPYYQDPTQYYNYTYVRHSSFFRLSSSLRYAIFLNDKSNFYIQAGISFGKRWKENSSLTYFKRLPGGEDLVIKVPHEEDGNWALGANATLGYSYKRFGIEAKYNDMSTSRSNRGVFMQSYGFNLYFRLF